MPSDPSATADFSFDSGLLVPGAAGHDSLVSDEVIGGALVTAEAALVRAWAAVGAAPGEAAEVASRVLGWRGSGEPCVLDDRALKQIVIGSVSGGNPVIPLVALLREWVPESTRAWVHHGATSQDILDSGLMLVAHRAATEIVRLGTLTSESLHHFATKYRDLTASSRTLTQHAVPTTVGFRALGWNRALRRAITGLDRIRDDLPAQLAGAGGTSAAFVQIAGEDAALQLSEAFADELGLRPPDGPWHTARWPITELGDALVSVCDALGKIAGDIATLSRTEIAEVSEGNAGGSSTMPHKNNPTQSVLIRSAALRSPLLAATLHSAAAAASDERPDGAWHAEWPTLRELLRVTLGAIATANELLAGLSVNYSAVAENLEKTGGMIVSERLRLVLQPCIGAERTAHIITAANDGADLATLLRDEPSLVDVDITDLLDPSRYTGLAVLSVDHASQDHGVN